MARNLIYLHSHDTGRHISPYGWPVPTPHLQRFAESAVLFRNAFCVGPTCSPSRAGLLTGQWAHQTGMLGLAHRGWSLNDYSRTLPSVLKAHGYETVLTGIQHIASWKDAAARSGYTLDLRGARPNALAACDYLRSAPDRPFFLDVGFSETHQKFPAPACDSPLTDPRYAAPPPYLPDTPETRWEMAAYNTMARTLDGYYGSILDTLEATGLAEDTVVLITTDHGIPVPRAKCNLTDRGIGVLLMLRGPGDLRRRAGSVVAPMVSHVDVFPTLCELLGLDRPSWLVGESMMPLVRGERESLREDLFAEVTYHAAYEPQRCVRTERWKYIRRFDDRRTPVLPNCDECPSKAALLARGWRDEPRPPEMLFDLVADPQESANLAADPAHAATLGDLRGRLDRWMRDTADPLLDMPEGFVPLPPGGTANDPDGDMPDRAPIVDWRPGMRQAEPAGAA